MRVTFKETYCEATPSGTPSACTAPTGTAGFSATRTVPTALVHTGVQQLHSTARCFRNAIRPLRLPCSSTRTGIYALWWLRQTSYSEENMFYKEARGLVSEH